MVIKDEILDKKKEIKELKEDLKLKEKVFDLIKKDKKKEARKILEKNNFVLSYFRKFKSNSHNDLAPFGKVITEYIGGWDISYDSRYENDITEDLRRYKKEIEEKENRLEQKIYLQKQQKYMDLQIEDITKKDLSRKKIENFTLVLAFGVVVSLLYNLFNTLNVFQNAQNLHSLLIAGIFCLVFAIFFTFISDVFDIRKEVWNFIKRPANILLVFFLFWLCV
jgi:hypothetical protein